MAAKKTKHDQVPLLEWVAAGFGALVAAVLIGLIGWNAAISDAEAVPQIKPEIVRIIPADGGHLLDIRLTNSGAQSAASVQIEVNLKKGGELVETSRATIDYVPARSEALGGLIVRADPRTHEVDLRVTGFQIP